MNVITAILNLLDSHSKLSRDLAEIKRNTSGLPHLIADIEEIKRDVKALSAAEESRFNLIEADLATMKGQLARIEEAVTAPPRLADFGWVESQSRKR